MNDIHDQVHSRFKLFSGSAIADVTAEATRFCSERKVAAKSIGVEYLEGAKRFVLTVGYRDDETPYEVTLSHHALGRAENLDDLSAIETAMGEVAGKVPDLICHELYIDEGHQFFLIVMSLKS